jgi:flagellar basal body-associated protein FliL
VSDENNKNQDSELDQNRASEEDLLSDIDAILAEEDPDFLNQINKIKIESAGLDLSIMDQALGLTDIKSESTLLSHLTRPFEFRTNTKAVVIFWVGLLLATAAVSLVWNFKGHFLNQKLFITSLAELGSEIKDYNPNNEVEPFYDNPRFAKNLVSVSTMHVNLKPSESSGPNPMLAIEVTVEGLSVDAIVEIKDREAEFKDMLARATEEQTYDDLVLSEGKQALCEQYRDLLNGNLTRGQVRRVLLKSFIIKP